PSRSGFVILLRCRRLKDPETHGPARGRLPGTPGSDAPAVGPSSSSFSRDPAPQRLLCPQIRRSASDRGGLGYARPLVLLTFHHQGRAAGGSGELRAVRSGTYLCRVPLLPAAPSVGHLRPAALLVGYTRELGLDSELLGKNLSNRWLASG